MNASGISPDDDRRVDSHGVAAVTLTVFWDDGSATHEDRLHVRNFSVWREGDLLPPAIGGRIAGMRGGETITAMLQPGEAVAGYSVSGLLSPGPSAFNRSFRQGISVDPRLGRFYPLAFFGYGQGPVGATALPARITRLAEDLLEIDTNHPLAAFPLELHFHVDRVLPEYDRHGGRCSNPLEELLQYPGLAAPLADGRATDYGDHDSGMSRMDERPDAMFYSSPRLVQHFDSTALATVNSLYRRLIPEHARVLDLMASHDSHLQGIVTGHLLALGMNERELAANTAADAYLLQDLNSSPRLQMEPDSLDAVVCTASIEYLTAPDTVMEELVRVLRPGGIAVICFTNRWFPGKAIRIWSELHEFERVGMVTQWMRQAGFVDMHTCSARGWPRPEDDRHIAHTGSSDPVYAVWGCKPAR